LRIGRQQSSVSREGGHVVDARRFGEVSYKGEVVRVVFAAGRKDR
jgi:hypothetical protein